MSSGLPLLRVVEPQLQGIFHAPFNAALLHAVVLAHPQTEIVFHAAASHIEVVRQILSEHAAVAAHRVQWEPCERLGGAGLWQRAWSARQHLRELLAMRSPLLFCSISRLQLLLLQRAMGPVDQVRCVLHGDLDSVEQPIREPFPQSLFALRRVLAQQRPEGLRYLLLSSSIRQHLPAALRAAMEPVGVLDHPYHFPLRNAAPRAPKPLVFCIFGNTGDAHAIEHVARAVHRQRPEVRFRLAGFLRDEATAARVADVLENATATPLSREHFCAAAEAATHALWLAEPEGFRLRASGTFFDALAFLRPILYTANPYLDGYHLEEAGVGQRCASLEAVIAAIVQRADRVREPETAAEYAHTVERMRAFRERFTPESVALTLPAVLGWRR